MKVGTQEGQNLLKTDFFREKVQNLLQFNCERLEAIWVLHDDQNLKKNMTFRFKSPFARQIVP